MKTTLAIAAAFLAVPSMAAAQNAPSATVKTTDLDLSTKAGQDKLDKRVDQTIRRMCRVDGFDAAMLRQQADCRLAAKANAGPKVAFAIEASRTGHFASIELDAQG